MSTSERLAINQPFSTIILAAGVGKRMYSKIPKVIHCILGKPVLAFVVDLAKTMNSDEIIVVVGTYAQKIKETIGQDVNYIDQPEPLGTGDAAKKGLNISRNERVLILNGDVPLLQSTTISGLLHSQGETNADLALLTCEMKNPEGYGRILRNKRQNIVGIAEQADATPAQKRIKEINTGVYFGKKEEIVKSLNMITSNNEQKELYLTDCIAKLLAEKKKVIGLKALNEHEIMGINTRAQLAQVREIVKKTWFSDLMARGVYIEDPSTTNIDLSVRIGQHVHIRPFSLIEGKTDIKDGSTIGPFAWIKDGQNMNCKGHAKED